MPKIRVLVDGFFMAKPYGFGRFIFELCRALSGALSEAEIIVAIPERVCKADLIQLDGLIWEIIPESNFVLWEQISIPRAAKRLKCDIIHFPYNTRALQTFGIPTVTTVHDLIFLEEQAPVKNLKSFIASIYSRIAFQACTRRSDVVVGVSDTTCRKLLERGVKAKTVYNTVDGFLSLKSGEGHAYGGRPYILHRGGYHHHRNTARVIAAFRSAREQISNVDLQIIGVPDGAAAFGAEADSSIIFVPRVTDQELANLYAGSVCVVAASLKEGFGLPIIEAFGFGVPVITARVDPMKEVAGDAALLVDPTDTVAISQAIVSVVSDRALAASMVERGSARMPIFSSRNVGEQMMAVYQSCVRRDQSDASRMRREKNRLGAAS